MQIHVALSLTLDSSAPDVVAIVGGGGKSSAVFRLATDAAAVGHRTLITHTARIAAFQTAWAPAYIEYAGGPLPLDKLERLLATHGCCLLTGPLVGDRRSGLQPTMVDELTRRAPELGVACIAVEADGSKMRPLKAPAEHEPVVPDSTTLLAPMLGLDAIGASIDAQHVHRPELVRRALGLDDTSSFSSTAGVLDAEEAFRLTPAQAAQLMVHPAGGAKGRLATARFVPLLNKADEITRLVAGRLAARCLAARGQPALLTAVGQDANSPNGSPRDPVVERWGPVAAVVLAAGGATRMGRPKQVELVGGVPMIVRAVHAALQSDATPVLVVTGAYEPLVRQALHAGILDREKRVHYVHNPAWESGQASSAHVALRALASDVQAAIFLPVDQPYLDPVLLRQLIRCWQMGARLAAPTVDGELRGAPALFDRSLFADLLAVRGDVGGRPVLRQHEQEVAPVRVPADWLRDIDYPADLP